MPSHLSRACTCCVQAFKFLPVIFIVTVLVWSYYSYVILLCFFAVDNIIQRIAYLLLYHFLIIMLSWSYWQTIFTPVGLVPKRFQISALDVEKLERAETQESQKQILEQLAANLPVVTRTTFGVRYCDKCLHIKPDRAHHCSVCGSCVLKMDHHCPWVNNCVGFSNYKYFLLFLGYAVVYCLFVAATTLPYFVKFWKNELDGLTGRFHVLFLFFVALMFAVSLVSLFGYHIFLVLRNRTTLEAFRAPLFRTGPDKNGFSLGKYNNFVEVFGEEKRLWFVPVFTSRGEGSTFPWEPELSSAPVPPTYDSMGVTQAPSPVFSGVTDQPSMGDGIAFPQRNLEEDRDTLLGTQQRWAEEGGESSDRSGDDHTVDLVGTSSFPRQSSNRGGSVAVNMEPV